MAEFCEIEKLEYEIVRYSSFATSYLPENILDDCPSNQASRWSSNTNNPPQFLTLKLKRPAIVKKIKFGKFEKSHVCNLKKFKIYGGLEEDEMVLLLESGLRNDPIPETFNLLTSKVDGEKFPIIYIKIMPLLSWGPSFNFSIWYIELHGQDDPMYMCTSLRSYNTLREIEIVKLCLKHFRQQGYTEAFKALQEHTNIRLEHPIISELYKCLVQEGDFSKAEEFIEQCVTERLMDSYVSTLDYKHSWKIQMAQTAVRPGNRGGHQLIVDTNKHLIYLYGGWDGYHDLSDFWCFDVKTSIWTLIHENCELVDGPKPRSCHKMVFDPITNNIFMIGRYLDNSIRTTEYIKSDFYLYGTETHTWLQICDDTSQVGGPQLVYDHQMCIDVEKRTIYVFGGKILTPKSVNQISSEAEYSGLFSYHIDTNTWQQILVDCSHPSASKADVCSIKSRINHCMVFHKKNRKLYIYGGQRGKEEIDEFLSFDVDGQVINILNPEVSGYLHKNEPPAGFTQRATIDTERDEIHVFSSLSKQKDRRDPQQMDPSNSFWVYSLKSNKWSKIYTYKFSKELYNKILKSMSFGSNIDYNNAETNNNVEPIPRYAHQLVYDEIEKIHYLFGGNPGKISVPHLRLDDFWVLHLEKPDRSETLRHCKYLVRKLKYEEITKLDPIKALEYLQKHISEVIDHGNAEQLNQFHKLASLLFKSEEEKFDLNPLATTSLTNYDAKLFTDLNTSPLTMSNKPMPKSQQLDDSNMDDLSNQSDDNTSAPSSMSSPSQMNSLTTIPNDANLNEQNSISPKFSNPILSSKTDLDSYELYKLNGGKKALDDYLYELKNRRTYLFNQIVQLMPRSMVQPKDNLSDFVLI